MESDTPLTDAEAWMPADRDECVVSAYFARQLERDLAAERATTASLFRTIALIREAGGFTREDLAALPDAVEAMREQRDEARQEVCRMVSDADQSSHPDSAKEVAERRGWDCFKEGGGA